MTRDSLWNQDWDGMVARLGGAEGLAAGARATKAFERPRGVSNAVDLLRLILAYCLGARGLRSTAAWAATGLADVSNVALLNRLRRSGDWLAMLVGQVLGAAAPAVSKGRLIRIVDGIAVAKAGAAVGRGSHLWRIHSAFDLPSERFGWFALTDEREGERLDRIPVVRGEIRIPVVRGEIRLADRAYLKPERMAAVLEAGADVVVRGRLARCPVAQGGRHRLRPHRGTGRGRGRLADRPANLARTQIRRAAGPAPCRSQEARPGRRRPAQGQARRPAGAPSGLQGNAGRSRLGDPGHVADPRAVPHAGRARALSAALGR